MILCLEAIIFQNYHFIKSSNLFKQIKRPPEGGLFSVPDQLTNAAGSGQISWAEAQLNLVAGSEHLASKHSLAPA